MSPQEPPESISETAKETPPPAHQSRRTVLKVIAAGVGGGVVGAVVPAVLNHVAVRSSVPWRFFTEAEAALVDAICEQIIPADQDPGARDARCVNFIDRQLDGKYRRLREAYRTGLAAVQATSREMFAKPFEQLSWDDQTRLLQALDSNRAPAVHWKSQSASSFFDMMIRHTMQGFYGSPRHGGNRDYVSYRMLRLEYPRVIGRNRHPGL